MNMSSVMWVLLTVLIVVPVVLTALVNRFMRRRGGVDKGWGGTLFVLLCWIAALALILSNVHID